MIKCKVFHGQSAVQAAQIALRSRLYVSGWCLSHTLRGLIKSHSLDNKFVVLAYDGSEPIGVVYAGNGELQAFVRKSYRRQGIGSKMIGALKKGSTSLDIRSLHHGYGIDGSMSFWKKVK